MGSMVQSSAASAARKPMMRNAGPEWRTLSRAMALKETLFASAIAPQTRRTLMTMYTAPPQNACAVIAPVSLGLLPRTNAGAADANVQITYTAQLKSVRRGGLRSMSCDASTATNATGTAYLHPNRIELARMKTKASDTLRSPFSSSGTGLASASAARPANSAIASPVSTLGGSSAIITAARPVIGNARLSAAPINIRSGTGYGWSGVLGAAPMPEIAQSDEQSDERRALVTTT